MNRSAINSAPLGIGFSTANQYFSAAGLLRLIDTTLTFGGTVGLSAAATLTLDSVVAVGVRVLMAAENALLTLSSSSVLGVARLAPMLPTAQVLSLGGSEAGTARRAMAANALVTFVGPGEMGVLHANWLAASQSMTLTGTANFYDGPRTPAPLARMAGVIDLSVAPRTVGVINLGV